MGDSLRYYSQHAREFFDSTRDVEFIQIQGRLLSYLKPGARILNFGCGSKRGTKYLISREYMADTVDGSVGLVKIASEYTDTDVRQMLFQDLDERETYEGVWACSSILHLTSDELAGVFGKMHYALVPYGVLYTSFKYRTGGGKRDSRYFTDMTEEKTEGLLKAVHGFATLEIWVTSDMRPGGNEEQWLDMVLRRR